MDAHINAIRNELFLLETALRKNTLSKKTKETSKCNVKANKKKDLSKFNTTQLKEFAKKNKLKASGKKDEMIELIWKFMNNESSDESSDSSESSDDSSDSD
jgi:hypothetical protein